MIYKWIANTENLSPNEAYDYQPILYDIQLIILVLTVEILILKFFLYYYFHYRNG